MGLRLFKAKFLEIGFKTWDKSPRIKRIPQLLSGNGIWVIKKRLIGAQSVYLCERHSVCFISQLKL
jgi:hypothetical protein